MKIIIQIASTLISIIGIMNSLFGQVTGDSINIKSNSIGTNKDKENQKEIKFVGATMIWDAITFQYAGNDTIQRRNDIYIRRGRFGVQGKFKKDMSFQIMFAYDGIGKSKYTAADGAPNADDNQNFFLLDAIYMWNVKPLFNIVLGYFRPQVGKESITSSFNVTSFVKTLPNVQPRQHLFGRSTGRETGINIGGLYLKKGWSMNYNLGLYDPNNTKIVGYDTKWSPLTTARLAFTLGNPEMSAYKISYTQCYFGNRNGTTIGFNGALQGKTDIFKYNSMYSVDILSNYGRFDFNAEYDWLNRNSFLGDSTNVFTSDKVISIKLAYLIKLKNEKYLQPSIAYSSEQPVEIGDAKNINALTGSVKQQLIDIGVNWYLEKEKFKISLHYINGKRQDKAPYQSYSYLGGGFQLMY